MAEEKKDSKVPEIVATSLAGLTSAYVGSYFGVAGTTIGLAFGSLVSGIAAEYYKVAIKHGTNTLKDRLKKKDSNAAPSSRDIKITEKRADGYTGYFSGTLLEAPPKAVKWNKLNWKWAITIMVVTFVVGFGSISILEFAKGSPISGGNHGTTLSGLFGQATQTKVTKTSSSRMETTTETPWTTTTIVPTTTQVPESTTISPASSSTPQTSDTVTSPDNSTVPTTTAVLPSQQTLAPQVTPTK